MSEHLVLLVAVGFIWFLSLTGIAMMIVGALPPSPLQWKVFRWLQGAFITLLWVFTTVIIYYCAKASP